MVTMRAILGPACGFVMLGCNGLFAPGGLEFEGTAQAVKTEEGPGVHAEITITNSSNTAQRLEGGSACPFIFHVLDKHGIRVWRDHDAGNCLMDIARGRTLAPGESWNVERTLLVQDVLRSDGDPGEYMVAAYFHDPGVIVDLGRFLFRH